MTRADRYTSSLYASGAAPVATPLVPAERIAPPPQAVQPIRVLVVDDHFSMRRMIAQTLSTGNEFDVVGEADDGEQAVALTTRLKPDVLLIDLVMPNVDGVEAIARLRRAGVRTPALVLTSNADRESISRAMEAGADGYVLKGASAADLRTAIRQVGRGGAVLAPAVTRAVIEDYANLIEERRRRDVAVIRTLAGAVERRDRVTGDHINTVASLSVALYRHMCGTDPAEDMVYGFLLHDVGKIGIPDAILLKPGALDEQEIETMRRHVQIGVEMIAPLGFTPVVTDVIRCHHERWDGRGYPGGLRGDQIPPHARMFSVVDAYDAMTADRPYRRGMTPAVALDELDRAAGSQFDPACVRAFATLAPLLGLV